MAQVFPDGWRELTATGAAGRELRMLAAAVADHGDVLALEARQRELRLARARGADHAQAKRLALDFAPL